MKIFTAGLLFAGMIGVAMVGPVADAAAQDRAISRVPPRAAKYPSVGHRVRALPQNHRKVRVSRHDYYYHRGAFYRPYSRDSYIVVRAPLGARVRSLPVGYVSFYVGPQRYYYVNYTYYYWDEPRRDYVVVKEPKGAERAVVAASEAGSGEMFVYPNRGQSEERRERDRYECYLWAVDQTGYDPGATASGIGSAGDYRRAISACLEGRGYTVK